MTTSRIEADTARYRARIAAAYDRAHAREAAAVKLTPAAKRDLALIQAGQRPELRYGPYLQLVAAGYIVGPQEAWRVAGA